MMTREALDFDLCLVTTEQALENDPAPSLQLLTWALESLVALQEAAAEVPAAGVDERQLRRARDLELRLRAIRRSLAVWVPRVVAA